MGVITNRRLHKKMLKVIVGDTFWGDFKHVRRMLFAQCKDISEKKPTCNIWDLFKKSHISNKGKNVQNIDARSIMPTSRMRALRGRWWYILYSYVWYIDFFFLQISWLKKTPKHESLIMATFLSFFNQDRSLKWVVAKTCLNKECRAWIPSFLKNITAWSQRDKCEANPK